MLELFTFIWEIRKLLLLRKTEKRKNSCGGEGRKRWEEILFFGGQFGELKRRLGSVLQLPYSQS